jgi:hypothetical protein
MATTAEQVFVQAMALADEMTDVINTLNASDTASYRARTPGILTVLQSELVKIGEYYKSFEFSNKPIHPLAGESSGFDYLTFDGTDIIKDSDGAAYAYSFEVDGESTVYVEDYNGVWNVLTTVSATDPTTRQFTAYKGVVTPTAGATRSRLRFSGTYEYTITNYALFGIPMKLARVPSYAPFFKVSMPSDFKSIEQVINEYPVKQYGKDITYKFENSKDLYIDYFYEGVVRINYRPIPDAITAMTDVIVLDDVTARTLLPYGLAADLFKEENTIVSKFCRDRYMELKATQGIRHPSQEQQIVDVYGGF